MINLERILKQDRQIRVTTGLNRKAFEALLPSFEEAYQQMLENKRRWRTLGGGATQSSQVPKSRKGKTRNSKK